MNATDSKRETGYLQKALTIFISIGLTVSSWFLTTAYGEMNTLNTKIQAVELSQATVSGNRFTSSDWMAEKRLLEDQRIVNEKRVSALEENMKNVRELLMEIKADLKIIKEKHYTAALTEN